MKLKYYLRGLGIGIVVTAVIMSITNKPQEMTDAQIKMRALELGMVEEHLLSDLQAKNEAEDEVSVEDILNEFEQEKELVNEEPSTEVEDASVVEGETEEESAEAEIQEVEVAETETEESVITETEDVVEESSEEITTEDNKNEYSIEEEVMESYTIIKVEKGNGSEVVSKRLYEAGLVESAVEYNQFLVKNGYDRKLCVGNHEVPSTATYDEMARILCGMK